MSKQTQLTVDFLRERTNIRPKIGLILGSGLNGLAKDMDVRTSFSYSYIPHFPISTVDGHEGRLLFGTIGETEIMVMQGRFHYYEGYTMQEITFPVRVMKALGVHILILSNAAGGMNPDYKVGDIVLITDHINCFPEHPLRGKNDEAFGDRFPDMSAVYSPELIEQAEQIALQHQIALHKGVYVGTQGPSFETPAEYRMFRIIGGDCVGMSTVPEAIVARHAGMRCVAFSVITDMGIVGSIQKVSHKEVIKAAGDAEPKLSLLVKELITRNNK
ncbi:MAG: purine-nucleoside phosphorylase [Bacteroidales bacterium]|nr:purine-nucleoside phosphorylase [Bacteroidales bacterium]